MKIAILSDTRLPTNLAYQGHGLGRAICRLAMGLARRGHAVTVYGGFGSAVEGCRVVEDAHEDQRAHRLHGTMGDYDAIVEGSHRFAFAEQNPDLPVVCKVVDKEGHAPYRRVYGNQICQDLFGKRGDGVIVPEGINVDDIPFSPNGRCEHLVFTANFAAWKKPEIAVQVAQKAGVPIHMVGEAVNLPFEKQYPPLSGQEFYNVLMGAKGLILPMSGMGLMEAAASGTPGISMLPHDDWVCEGVTGYICPTVDKAARAVDRLGDLDPHKMRDWIATERSLDSMAAGWEAVLERAANGEEW